jgi:aminopeptidase N
VCDEQVQPTWNSLDDQMMESLLAVFSVDALQSSHPVSAKIKHPSEISQIFDSISYSKGKNLKIITCSRVEQN